MPQAQCFPTNQQGLNIISRREGHISYREALLLRAAGDRQPQALPCPAPTRKVIPEVMPRTCWGPGTGAEEPQATLLCVVCLRPPLVPDAAYLVLVNTLILVEDCLAHLGAGTPQPV